MVPQARAQKARHTARLYGSRAKKRAARSLKARILREFCADNGTKKLGVGVGW